MKKIEKRIGFDSRKFDEKIKSENLIQKLRIGFDSRKFFSEKN